MKKLVNIISICFLFSNLMFAQSNDPKEVSNKQYCAMLRDGIMKVQIDGVYLTADVSLSNGNIITTDGMVIKREGGQIVLNNGECVDYLGHLIAVPAEKATTQKDVIITKKKKH